MPAHVHEFCDVLQRDMSPTAEAMKTVILFLSLAVLTSAVRLSHRGKPVVAKALQPAPAAAAPAPAAPAAGPRELGDSDFSSVVGAASHQNAAC